MVVVVGVVSLETVRREVMDEEKEGGNLAFLLSKGCQADSQIAYSHERICNERQCATTLNPHARAHTHTRRKSAEIASIPHSPCQTDHQRRKCPQQHINLTTSPLLPLTVIFFFGLHCFDCRQSEQTGRPTELGGGLPEVLYH